MYGRRSTWSFIACMAACVVSLAAIASERRAPKEAVVVLSREADPFRKCEKAAREVLQSDGWSVRTVVLDDKSSAGPVEGYGSAKLLTVGTEATEWSKGKGLETVFCMVADAEGAGLATSPAIAGILAEIPAARQVALIKQGLPNAKVIGVLYKKDSARGERSLAGLRAEAAKAGLNVEAEGVDSKDAIGAALNSLLKRGIDILWTMPDGSLYDANTIKAVLRATLEERVPVFGFSTPVVRAGALMGVGITPEAQGRQAARLMIARSSNPTAGQMVAPEFEITVNQVVAERLGVTLPTALAAGSKGD
ncbi:MAG: ABC transporter substrate binding protein [Phycisphaerales bacterium]|nr:ABC transporter substrate binding protein [Phycisphaerales bacterium]